MKKNPYITPNKLSVHNARDYLFHALTFSSVGSNPTPTEADVIKIISKRFPKLKIEVPGMSSMNI